MATFEVTLFICPLQCLCMCGDLAITGSWDTSMIMWDIHKGELKLRMDEHSDGVYQTLKIDCDLSLCIFYSVILLDLLKLALHNQIGIRLP